jgi:hypothetical protein
MLKVVKIIEGGINLETQEELPRSIVISNGHREVHVAVNDNVIKELVALFVDNGSPRDVDPEDVPRMKPRPPPSPRPVRTEPESPLESPELDEDDGFEPGEEFRDSGTGASSL